MSDASGELLAQVLESNEILVDLDVSRNHLRESAGNLIRLAKSLHRLNLSRQELGRSKQSIESICRGLSENRTLLHLDMSGCGLSEEDTHSIADSLKFNRTLLGIHLHGNCGYIHVDPYGFLSTRTSRTCEKNDFISTRELTNDRNEGVWIGSSLRHHVSTSSLHLDDKVFSDTDWLNLHEPLSNVCLESRQRCDADTLGCWLCGGWSETHLVGDVIIPEEKILEYKEKKKARLEKKKRLSQDRARERDEVDIIDDDDVVRSGQQQRKEEEGEKNETTTTTRPPLKLYVHFYCDRWSATRVRITTQQSKNGKNHVHIARVLPPGRQHFVFSLTGRMDDSFVSSAFEHDDVILRYPVRANFINIKPRLSDTKFRLVECSVRPDLKPSTSSKFGVFRVWNTFRESLRYTKTLISVVLRRLEYGGVEEMGVITLDTLRVVLSDLWWLLEDSIETMFEDALRVWPVEIENLARAREECGLPSGFSAKRFLSYLRHAALMNGEDEEEEVDEEDEEDQVRRAAFTYETSIFYDRRKFSDSQKIFNTKRVIKSGFESDLDTMCMERFVSDETECIEITNLLRPHYESICELFEYICAVNKDISFLRRRGFVYVFSLSLSLSL